MCTEIVDLDPSAYGTDGIGGRRFGGRFSRHLTQGAGQTPMGAGDLEQQEQMCQLRRRADTGTEAIAHNRGPRDNDKFVYNFKGGNVERARARRVHDAERRLKIAERNAMARPPDPLRFRARLSGLPSTDNTAENAVQVRDLDIPGRVRISRLDVPTGG